MKNRLALLLAYIGALDCVFVPVLFGAAIQQPFFPFPGLYFLEISLLGFVGLISAMQNPVEKPVWGQYAPWGTAGILLAFNILGAWTIGLYLIPGTLAFLGVGFLQAEKATKIWQRINIFLVAAFVQGILMLAVIWISR